MACTYPTTPFPMRIDNEVIIVSASALDAIESPCGAACAGDADPSNSCNDANDMPPSPITTNNAIAPR